MKNDLNDRLFVFAVSCLKFIRTLSDAAEYRVIKYQLAKSATSAGANYEEAQAGSSRRILVIRLEFPYVKRGNPIIGYEL